MFLRAGAEQARRLGVGLTLGLTRRGVLTRDKLRLTGPGEEFLGRLGIDLAPHRRRALIRSCLNWTERRPHAGGSREAIATRLFDRG